MAVDLIKQAWVTYINESGTIIDNDWADNWTTKEVREWAREEIKDMGADKIDPTMVEWATNDE